MRARLTLMLLAIVVCSVSAQQPAPTPARAAAARPAVPAGVGGAPAGVPAPSAAERATIAEVLAFEKKCEDAAVNGDAAFLEHAVASTFIMTHGSDWRTGGMPIKVDTKATWVEYIKQRPTPYIYRNLDSVQVELHGDIAITIGRYRYLPRSNSPTPRTSHNYVWFERLYAKRNGEWQFLSHRTVDGPSQEPDSMSSK